MSPSSSSSTEFDMQGFILCLGAYLCGPENLTLFLQQHSTTTMRPQRIFWKSPLLVSATAEETEEPESNLLNAKLEGASSNTTIRMMDPVIVLLNAMFEYNPNNIKDHSTTTAAASSSSSSASKLSLHWGALMYDKNATNESDSSNGSSKYYYVESSRLTFRDLQRHFGVLDVPLDDLDNDITVLAKNMAMALLHIGCNNNNNPTNPPPPPPPSDDNDDETGGVLKFPLYYQGFEMYSPIILANNLLQLAASTNRQKENVATSTTTTTTSSMPNDVAAAAATISPYSLGQWRAMLDACASSKIQQQQSLSDDNDKKTQETSTTTKSTSHANKNRQNEKNDNDKASQDEKNDVAVKNLLKLYNTSFRHSASLLAAVGKENDDDDDDAAAAPSSHDTSNMAATLQPPGKDDDANSPSSSSSPATTADGKQQQAKKKKRRRAKGGYFEQKKAKPLAYADD